MTAVLNKIYRLLIRVSCALQDCLLLLLRLYWGISFMLAGYGKLTDISPVIEYFISLKLPFPVVNAYLVGAIECIGGLCLILGFATRLAAIPLVVIMSVALFTAHQVEIGKVIDNPETLLMQLPFTYLLVCLILFTFGPGRISLDYLFEKFFFSSTTHKSKHVL